MTRTIITAGLMFALALPGAALAQTAPTKDAYGGNVPDIVTGVPPAGEVKSGTAVGGSDDTVPPSEPRDVVESGAPRSAQPSISTPVGNLPFTGLDVGLIAAGGLLLLGVGFGMRRITRHSD